MIKGMYRVRYKKGDFEIEIESFDKDYVEQTLQNQISSQKLYIPPNSEPGKKPKPQKHRKETVYGQSIRGTQRGILAQFGQAI